MVRRVDCAGLHVILLFCLALGTRRLVRLRMCISCVATYRFAVEGNIDGSVKRIYTFCWENGKQQKGSRPVTPLTRHFVVTTLSATLWYLAISLENKSVALVCYAKGVRLFEEWFNPGVVATEEIIFGFAAVALACDDGTVMDDNEVLVAHAHRIVGVFFVSHLEER